MRASQVGFSSLLLLVSLGLAVHAGQPPQPPANAAGKKGTPAEKEDSKPVSYHEVIAPLLAENCTSCHNLTRRESGLRVETPAALFKGGKKHGSRLIAPGDPKRSALIGYLRGTLQPRMPTDRSPLTEKQIRQFELWIEQGAKIDDDSSRWAFKPPQTQAVPQVKEAAWVRNPIDAFILAKLGANRLKPSPSANKTVLMRRVYADLIGLPPSPQEAALFLNDSGSEAYERLVDRLLDDPRYGERWARHWLDLARYADTSGTDRDEERPRAWRYRDYVIRALNADKPYDRFLKEQIAGDELFPNEPDALIATGFARLGVGEKFDADDRNQRQEYLNDVTDTVSTVMLGLTVGCARCHNHKYDPITQTDYYRMQAFFAASNWVDASLPLNNDPPAYRERFMVADARVQPIKSELETLRNRHRALLLATKTFKPGQKREVRDYEIRESIDKDRESRELRDRLEDELRKWEPTADTYRPAAEAIADESATAPETHVLENGELYRPKEAVKPGFIAEMVKGRAFPTTVALPPDRQTTGRRAALANWIASRDNPLTARVIVNRLWQHHFGRGLVATPSDFGKNGMRPTHPELLDWLALRFVAEGWSLKKMHRLMLLSNAYRQSSVTNPAGEQADPDNTLLWRMNRRRLEGEAIRDSILAVSGRLNPARYGPGVFPKLSEEALENGSNHEWKPSPEAEGRRRSLYIYQRRSLQFPLIDAFDGVDMNGSSPQRACTTVVPQALALFNSEFVRTEAKYLVRRILTQADLDRIEEAYRQVFSALGPEEKKLRLKQSRQFLTSVRQRVLFMAFQIALARLPTEKELQKAEQALAKQRDLQQKAQVAMEPRNYCDIEVETFIDLCHVLLNTNEFLYRD